MHFNNKIKDIAVIMPEKIISTKSLKNSPNSRI